MSEKVEDGGPAFPEVFTDTVGERGDYLQEMYSAGLMSLRDYFAAKAMQSIILAVCAGQHSASQEQGISEDAYKMADAMLAQRVR